MGVTDLLSTQHGCSRSRPLQGWISPRRGLHGQGCPDRALQGALRQVLRGLRREVRRGVLVRKRDMEIHNLEMETSESHGTFKIPKLKKVNKFKMMGDEEE